MYRSAIVIMILVLLCLGTFCAEKKHVYRVEASVADSALDEYPEWSPDGSKIAFQSEPYDRYLADRKKGLRLDEYDYDIWTMNADGSSPVNLTEDSRAYDGGPEWSPDGRLIAFTSNRSGNIDVWVMQADGSNPIDLTAQSEIPDFAPKWSPDGQYIAYATESDPGYSYGVWIVRPDGGSPIGLATEANHIYSSITWLPDSSAIAVTDNITAPNDPSVPVDPQGIQVISLQDHTRTNMLSGLRVYDLEWSPTNSTTFVYSTPLIPAQLWLVNGTTAQQITTFQAGYPVWSPDGTRIVFVAPRDTSYSVWDIWTYDTINASLTNLTADLDTQALRPQWSPDGKQIVYFNVAANWTVSDIWIMNADGTNKTNLTGGQ